jgi:predicted TPR repeat methyltransferase
MKRLLRRIPYAPRAYHHGRALFSVVYEGWIANRTERYDYLLAEDVWDFEKPVTLERYRRALDAVGSRLQPGTWGEALEIGCGVGVFTEMLARRCRRVTAVDISSVGCDRTRQRCRDCSNVDVALLDLQRDPITQRYDLVFAMDVLECIHGVRRVHATAARLASAINPGGLLVITMSRLPEDMRASWWARRLIEGGDAMVKFLDGRQGLRLVQCDRFEKYLVAVLAKQT